MCDDKDRDEWDTLSYNEKNAKLIRQQINLLDTLYERHAISQEDYEKSIQILTDKR